MKDRKKKLTSVHELKILLFGLMMTIMCLIGLLWFLRPETSEVEKRKLTEFPHLSLKGIWDGEYPSGIETWYADTFPGRETLIKMDHNMNNMYGLRETQIIGDRPMTADEIPDHAPSAAELKEESETSAESSEPEESVITPEPEESQPVEEESGPVFEEPDEGVLEDGTVHEIGEVRGNLYITNNCAYNLYYFSQEGADGFIRTFNRFYEELDPSLNVYLLLAPLNAGIMLDESVLADMNASDEKKAMEYVYSGIDEGVHTVNCFDRLKKHNAEYLYFHTDHHWTQLGAYYAYQEFCKEKDIQPHELDDFETMQFDGFLGTFYADSGQSPELEVNPDTVYAYVPNGTNDMHMITVDGEEMDWRIVNDVTDYVPGGKYGAFAGGDQPFNVCHNPEIHDGSSIVVVKDSFGNAFIPWLVDHYEYVYWLDVRYTTTTISQMQETYGIQDVLVLFHLYNATSTDGNTERLVEIGK